MRLRHFAAFAPRCPHCLAPLTLAAVFEQCDDEVVAGALHCGDADCQLEFPIIDGIPLLHADLRRLLGERGVELLLREDLHPSLESMFGDAIGPDSWFDTLRQTVSTYVWDSYADLDPEEMGGAIEPGAARRCLAALLALAPGGTASCIVDVGCAAGRTTFDLAAQVPDALVLGLDSNLALLRLARRAGQGRVAYARRRIGLAYDRRQFAVRLDGAERVDFWACDALALPFAQATAGLVAALNLLDCVPEPSRLLGRLAACLAPGGRLLLATPYDWATRATPLANWIGGHSQRAPHAGAGEVFLRTLLTEGAHPQSIPGLRILGEAVDWPWQTRLHDRAAVAYRSHLVAVMREAFPGGGADNTVT